MFVANYNTARSTQKRAPLAALHDKIRQSSSITFTTLGDGHAVPSIFAVTPAASTKVPKLMDTLCDPFRIAILSAAKRAKDLSVLAHPPTTVFLLDTPVEIESNLIAAESATSLKTSRYTFGMIENAIFEGKPRRS